MLSSSTFAINRDRMVAEQLVGRLDVDFEVEIRGFQDSFKQNDEPAVRFGRFLMQTVCMIYG